MATSLYTGQIPLRAKGQTTCIHHKGKQLDLYCNKCQELVCVKCISTLHESHPLCGLSDITPQNKKDIQNFIDKTEKDDIVQINQFITDKHLKDNTSTFEKISHQLQTQTNKLKEDLDLLTARTLSIYKQMEEVNAKLLQTYKQDLNMYNAQLKQKVQDCKTALQRGSYIQIYDVGCDIRSPDTLPVKPTLGTASFRPNRNPQSLLKQALGEVPSPVFTLLPQTKVLGDWWTPCTITSVCPTTDGQVWTCDYGSDTLTLLDRKGKVKQKVIHSTQILDISISPTTNTLWACDYSNNIAELVAGRLVHRFITSKTPECICITASNHVIVGMAKHISNFTTKGKLVLTTSAAGTGKPLVCKPRSISECPVTHNVAVADWDREGDGGNGKPHVIIMDTDFTELCVYDGEIPKAYQPTSQSGDEPFNPYSVLYDSVGNLVIGDCDNKRILLISGCGEFLRLIHTDDYCTWAVGVDREDVLWAVFRRSNVKLLQYSSV